MSIHAEAHSPPGFSHPLSTPSHKRIKNRAGEVAKWREVLTAKPGDWRSRTHKVGQNQNQVLTSTHIPWHAPNYTHSHVHIHKLNA